MIHFVDVNLKNIFEQGKEYPWIRPKVCPNCNHFKVWSHGFVARYFYGFTDSLYMKCYRCPECHCVITCRPNTHFPKVRCEKAQIRTSLATRIAMLLWPITHFLTSRMRYWMRNFKKKAVARLTMAWDQGLMAAFDKLLDMGIVHVSRST